LTEREKKIRLRKKKRNATGGKKKERWKKDPQKAGRKAWARNLKSSLQE